MCREELKETKRKLERLKDLQKIYLLWFRRTEKLFPADCRGKDIAGVGLVVLDADVAGCVLNFIHNETLRDNQLDCLVKSQEVLENIVTELDGYAYWYYGHLKKLVGAILEFIERWGIPIEAADSST